MIPFHLPKNRLLLTSFFFIFTSLINFAPPWPQPLPILIRLLLLLTGAALGFFLIEIDHFVYTLIGHPEELTSQRVANLLRQFKISSAISVLQSTQNERQQLFFHSFLFQVIFTCLTFWVISSTGSFFGKGLVLSLSFQIFLKQLREFQTQGNLSSWFWNFKLDIPQSRLPLYLTGYFFLHLLFAWWI